MPRHPLFKLLGVPVSARPVTLVSGLLLGALAYLMARRRGYGQGGALVLSLANLLLWYEAVLIHVTGHIVSSRASNAPMDYVDWGILAGNGYTNHDVTPQQHIGRAIGGPVASGLVALLYWLAWRSLKGRWSRAIAASGFGYNTLIAVGSMAPLPVVDGGVIYKNLREL